MNVFQLHDTHGIPIEFIAESFMENGMMINWFDWMKSAVKAGWKYEKISATIHMVNDNLFENKWYALEYTIPLMYLKITENKEIT